jgi:hypothetical protein
LTYAITATQDGAHTPISAPPLATWAAEVATRDSEVRLDRAAGRGLASPPRVLCVDVVRQWQSATDALSLRKGKGSKGRRP